MNVSTFPGTPRRINPRPAGGISKPLPAALPLQAVFSVFINRPSFKPLPVFILFAATFQNRIPAQILKTDIFMFLRINASDALNRYYGYSRLFRFFYDVFPVQNKRYSGFHCHSPYLVFF